jgi:energy-coupling factor transporter ATP-binding protein EcfA2
MTISSGPSTTDLRRISFGALAAERDFGLGLKDYFVESESFRRIRDGERFVVLGNRGSGKSAILKMVGEHERSLGSLVIELSPEDYSYELLNSSMTRESEGAWAKQGAYAAAWKYLIYVLAMKKLSGTFKGQGRKDEAARIHSYLRSNHANVELGPLDLLISYITRLQGFKVGNIEAGVKARELQKLYKLEEIESLLDDVNALCRRKRVTVVVDELDKGWDGSEDAVGFVAGLFQAAASINQRTPELRVLVSLRRELYENIPALYDDAQKVRDLIEVIEWDEPRLLDLVARRIAHSVPELAMKSPMDRWNTIFAETLEYRQNKSFNYVTDRTLYRPRELIQFCGDIKDRAVADKARPPVNYKVIAAAEYAYSETRLKDISAEYRFQYPGLASVFETFRGLKYTLDREELELHCLRIATGDLKVDTDAGWALDMDPDALIEVLWRVGFVRGRAVGGEKGRRRSGSSYLGSHQIAAMALKPLRTFHIHPMFRQFLGMKESKGGGLEDSEIA